MAHQSPMISIPRKSTDEVDWTTPIRNLIAQSYGESPDNYATECASLQRCRQDAVRGAGSDTTGEYTFCIYCLYFNPLVIQLGISSTNTLANLNCSSCGSLKSEYTFPGEMRLPINSLPKLPLHTRRLLSSSRSLRRILLSHPHSHGQIPRVSSAHSTFSGLALVC